MRYHFSEFFEAHDVEVPQVVKQARCGATATTRPPAAWTRRNGSPPHGARRRADQRRVRGLAGSWGFEQGKYDISVACGEQALLPAVRSAGAETVLVADGFSCKTQIEQAGTGRRALHTAQVMKLAREHGRTGHTSGTPQDAYYEQRPEAPAPLERARVAALAGMAAATLAAGGAAARGIIRRR